MIPYSPKFPHDSPLEIAKHKIRPGEQKDIYIPVSQTYSGDIISIPCRVIRAPNPGPTLFVTAAIHGDEVNGTGIVHYLMYNEPPQLSSGTLILIPVVNIFGFETHERYLPDRRDLNRSFPGSKKGSLANRYAATLMREIISKSNFGIDLHTAAAQRNNYPNIRADLSNPHVEKLALSFGCTLVINSKGPEGSLRRAACKADCPTIILEAGETFKIQPSILKVGVRGISNVLKSFNMIPGSPTPPPSNSPSTIALGSAPNSQVS